jgi:phosphoglycerate dehydrogenase-like enzyme
LRLSARLRYFGLPAYANGRADPRYRVTERPRIAVISAHPDAAEQWLAPLDGKADVAVGRSPEDLRAALGEATTIFLWGHPPLPFGDYLDLAPRVRWVHSSGAGIESLIVPQLLARAITLTNSRGAYSVAVAELALAMMLAWAKRLPERVLAQREHRWAPQLTRGMSGATLVIVGLGSIGSALARLAHGLEMSVIGVRRSGRWRVCRERPGVARPCSAASNAVFAPGSFNTVLPADLGAPSP